MVATRAPMQQLELVKEAKVFDILAGRLDPRLEASGVLAMDGLFYVIFDNLPHIACVGAELSPAAAANRFYLGCSTCNGKVFADGFGVKCRS